MNTHICGRIRMFFSVTAAAVFSGLFFAGCIVDNPVDSANGRGENSAPLILPSGFAWVAPSGRDACIFTSCDRVVLIGRDFQGWNWIVYKEGAYITDGDQIAVDFGSGDAMNGIYTFVLSGDGNRVTIRNNTGTLMVYTKTSGVHVYTPPTDPGTGGGVGGNIVLNWGEAWVNGAHATEIGIIFSSGNSVLLLLNNDGTWEIYSEGTYMATGNTTSVSTPRVSFTGAYSVSDDTYVIILNGETLVFTKRSGVYVSTH